MLPSNTVNVIVSFDNEKEPIEFKFLFEKLNWSNLVGIIQSSTTLPSPFALYYKTAYNSTIIKSLENQEQLEQLLTTVFSVFPQGANNLTLRLYGLKEQVLSPVFTSSSITFNRLGEFIDRHKELIQTSRRISHCIGHLAMMIAVSDSGKNFDSAFKSLEELIERKQNKLGIHGCRRQPHSPESDDVLSAADDEDFHEASSGLNEVDSHFKSLRLGSERGGRGGRHHGGRYNLFSNGEEFYQFRKHKHHPPPPSPHFFGGHGALPFGPYGMFDDHGALPFGACGMFGGRRGRGIGRRYGKRHFERPEFFSFSEDENVKEAATGSSSEGDGLVYACLPKKDMKKLRRLHGHGHKGHMHHLP
ncbi:MAG: hypothetical protein EXX96DRAFT_581667 [Benjaminiella poitrasii]|nr:MAG: hypothetical protein EXX96DRAFT_581667 [Benjaminiella poitrasii]